MVKRKAIPSVLGLLGDVGWYGFVPIIQQGTSLVLVPIYTYYLTPTDYGVVAVVALMTVLLGHLANWGVFYAILRDYLDYEGDSAREFLFTALIIAIVSSLVVYGSFFFIGGRLAPHIISEWRPEYQYYLYLALCTAIMQSVDTVAMTFLVVERRPGIYSTYQIIVHFLLTGFQLYLLIKLRMGVLALFFTPMLAAGVGMIGGLVILWPHLKFRWRWDAVRSIAHFGWQTVPVELSGYILRESDRWVLQFLLPLSQLGLYNFAEKYQMPLGIYADSIKKAWRPVYLRQLKEGRAASEIFRYGNAILDLSLVILLAGMLFSKEVIQLLAAPAYHSTYLVASILIVQVFFQKIVTFIPGNSLLYEKKLTYILIITPIASALNIGLALFLIPRMGLVGVALAIVLSFMAYAALTAFWAVRYSRVGCPVDWQHWLSLIAITGFLSIPAFWHAGLGFWALFGVKIAALCGFIGLVLFLQRNRINELMTRFLAMTLARRRQFLVAGGNDNSR